jgi:hypothetical protein
MTSISRLWIASHALLLFIPVMGLQVAIASQSPWWNLPWPRIGLWCLAVFLILFPLVRWMASGRAWAVQVSRVFGLMWVLGDIYLAIELPLLWMGIFALALALAVTFLTQWVRIEQQKSFVDSGARWYEGYPKALPGVKALIEVPEGEVEFRVSRVSRDGIFVFSEAPQMTGWSERRRELVKLRLEGAEQAMDLSVRFAHDFRDGLGGGLRFDGLSADQRKRLGDFVEQLKGEGYAVD